MKYKRWLYCFVKPWATVGYCPQNSVCWPGGGSEETYSSNRVWSADGSTGGEVSGREHHQPSGFNQSGVSVLVGSKLLTSTWRGLQYRETAQRYCCAYPLKGNQDPAPRLLYCFLTAPPWSLNPIPSLISNCLSLPFGTQGKSQRLNGPYFL